MSRPSDAYDPYSIHDWGEPYISQRLNLGSIVGEGLLPRAQHQRERNPERVAHAWQLRTMIDKGRLLTDGTNYAW